MTANGIAHSIARSPFRSSLETVANLVMLRSDDIFAVRSIVLVASESRFDASHDVRKVRFRDHVKRFASFLLARKESRPLHEAKVFRSQVTLNLASSRKFPNCISAAQEQLHHAQPIGMGERLQALRSLLQRRQGR
jgi:hypothetical protein